MVLKTSKGIPKMYLFNAAGGAFLLVTAALAVRYAAVGETAPPCTERYQSALLFSWQQPSGAALSPSDLQAKLGGRDWGVIENVSFAKADGAPGPVVMQVNLRPTPQRRPEDQESKGGMGFTWLPRQLAAAKVACLSYSVWLPEDFTFAPGGSLPGLFGGEPESNGSGKAKAATTFSAVMRWREDAGAEVRAATPGV